MRIAVGQIEPSVIETEENLVRVEEVLENAGRKNVDVLVLPELTNSGYVFDSMDEVMERAEDARDGELAHLIREWSKENRMVICGLCECKGTEYYNSATGFANGDYLGTYRKVHLFNREKDWFIPGIEEPPVFSFREHKFGVMICFDWAFPEMSRLLALKGAQVVLHPSNLVLAHCQKAMVTRSIENGVFTATANRVGSERGITFTGQSQITSPKGEVIVSMDERETGIIFADMDLKEADDKMITERNHLLEDRAPKVYSRLTE